jgi:ferrous iron transport protein B
MLGYGCSVPAVMATRILESPRDRRVTATLAILIPCSARSTVILGLVGAQLGALAAIVIYLVNLAVTAGLAVVLERKTAGLSPGLILEVPDLRAPSLQTVFARAWIAIREFLAIAWPMLIASSIVLSLLQISGLETLINRGLSPLTVTLLGLPVAVGVTIVFGVLRKELSLMMLMQALGTTAVATVMTPAQMISFALFVVFYVPCVATLAVLGRELGWKETAWISGMTVVLATAVAVAGRFAAGAFY